MKSMWAGRCVWRGSPDWPARGRTAIPGRAQGAGGCPGCPHAQPGHPLTAQEPWGRSHRVWDCGGEGRRQRRPSRPAGRAAGAPWWMLVAACSARRSPLPSKPRWRKSGSLGFLISPVDSPLQVWPGCRTFMGAGAWAWRLGWGHIWSSPRSQEDTAFLEPRRHTHQTLPTKVFGGKRRPAVTC